MVLNKRWFAALAIVIQLPFLVWSQGSALPLGHSNYHLVDRLTIKYGEKTAGFNTSLRGYERGKVVKFAKNLEANDTTFSSNDREDLHRIYLDNNEWVAASDVPLSIVGRRQGVLRQVGEDSIGALYRLISPSQIEACTHDERYTRCKKPILGYFFPTPANWLEVNRPGLHLRINPMIHLQAAKPNQGDFLFINKRGIEIRGGIDDRLFFYTNFTDTQGRFPGYVNEYVGKFKALPGNGFYKSYDSSVIDTKGAYDWLNGQAYIGFNVTRHVGLQFGHGKNFIGNGYRSMILSDFSHNYLYLKANWNIWRFSYQNLFIELNPTSAQANPGDNYIPRKYMAAHYLSFRVTERLSIGAYEATVFRRDTSAGGFELQYLNPVILYRTVEHLLDSEDNVLVGLDFKWDLFKRLRLYGQFMLDEFKLSEVRARNGWWGNKYGLQLGGLYVDALGIDQLDIRTEFNSARPYMYTHSDPNGANYSHYNQALAHPLGANFREALVLVRYQPGQKWLLEGRCIRSEYGEDADGLNWGSNILLPYATRVKEYENEIGQGVSTRTTLVGLDLSYEVWHNIYFDLHYFYRKKTSGLAERSGIDSFIGAGFRWNVSPLRMDF